jgi:hypothetical protein
MWTIVQGKTEVLAQRAFASWRLPGLGKSRPRYKGGRGNKLNDNVIGFTEDNGNPKGRLLLMSTCHHRLGKRFDSSLRLRQLSRRLRQFFGTVYRTFFDRSPVKAVALIEVGQDIALSDPFVVPAIWPVR